MGHPQGHDERSAEVHLALMARALEEAARAPEHGDVPIGAVVSDGHGLVISARHNEREQRHDPTAHAEILAIRDAAEALGSWRLDDCILAVTLEPCPMCAGAVINARIPAVVFGAPDPKAGAIGSLYNLAVDPRLNHQCTVVPDVLREECAALLQGFFRPRRG